MTTNHLTSLNVTCVQMVSPSPQVNYVALSPMHSIYNEKDTLFPCSSSLDFNLSIDMVTPSLGALELDLTPMSLIEFLDMYIF